ncbi:MAG TPA: hypothetical protein DDX19_18795 [Rhodopirellula baltica]|uniref:Uncharacterized protein n=1 Tax=Rhodopirellula baltica SH28 TaxID=993517 RepID=K5E3H6_RHOBT|nr:hypothetical protein RBSH_04337 [Rhodopirellula baltica SH28]HBE64756.1 hypothetical protein [Rhodopirellula baltica]
MNPTPSRLSNPFFHNHFSTLSQPHPPGTSARPHSSGTRPSHSQPSSIRTTAPLSVANHDCGKT